MSANTAPDLVEQTEGKIVRRTARVLLWTTLRATVLLGLLMVNLLAPRLISVQAKNEAAIEAAIVKSKRQYGRPYQRKSTSSPLWLQSVTLEARCNSTWSSI
jgi:Na+/H+-dicarboxylate symporter